MSKKHIFILGLLIAGAASWRVVNHHYGFAYNLELVTAASVLTALRYSRLAAVVVPLTAMAVSDTIMGNSHIFIATWGSFAIIGAGATLLRRWASKPGQQVAGAAVFAVVSSTLFYLVTNAGVWLQGYYAPGLSGLVASLAAGLPFYKTMLLGNLVLAPLAVVTYQAYVNYQPSRVIVHYLTNLTYYKV